MATAGNSTGRRFRFTLRSLFVLVTIVAIWLGWSQRVVYQRRVARQTIVEHGGQVVTRQRGKTENSTRPDAELSTMLPPAEPFDGPVPHVSWQRWLLGDQAVERIVLDARIDCGLSIEEIQRLFPEAYEIRQQ